MTLLRTLGLAALAAAACAPALADPPPLVSFNGAIGVEPLTAAGGQHVTNTVRGIAPGGRLWVIRKFSATVGTDGKVSAKGKGVLLGSGEGIATRGAVANVVVTLFCGPADATARRFTSPPGELSLAGDFSIKGVLSEDGVNAAVLPATCDNPQMLVRNFNAATGVATGWFAAGIAGGSDDD